MSCSSLYSKSSEASFSVRYNVEFWVTPGWWPAKHQSASCFLKQQSRHDLPWNAVLFSDRCLVFSPQGTGAASFDEFGNSKYQNRRTMSSSDRAMLNAFKEISTMADRINLPRNIVVSSNLEPSREAVLRTHICWVTCAEGYMFMQLLKATASCLHLLHY